MGPYELLEHIVRLLEGLQIPYLVTGSVAAMAYGEPRLTNDIDIVAAVEERHVPQLIAAFPSDVYYIDQAMIRRDTAFDASRFSRTRRIHPAETYEANFAAPEDVIIKKMEYYKAGGSDKHLRDITGILKISGDEVDKSYILAWAARLGLDEIWDALLKRIGEKK